MNCVRKKLDCSQLWRSRRTLMGLCIEMDIKKAYSIIKQKEWMKHQKLQSRSTGKLLNNPQPFAPNSINQLELTIGLNKSDATFGWKGFNRDMAVYYLHPGSL